MEDESSQSQSYVQNISLYCNQQDLKKIIRLIQKDDREEHMLIQQAKKLLALINQHILIEFYHELMCFKYFTSPTFMLPKEYYEIGTLMLMKYGCQEQYKNLLQLSLSIFPKSFMLMILKCQLMRTEQTYPKLFCIEMTNILKENPIRAFEEKLIERIEQFLYGKIDIWSIKALKNSLLPQNRQKANQCQERLLAYNFENKKRNLERAKHLIQNQSIREGLKELEDCVYYGKMQKQIQQLLKQTQSALFAQLSQQEMDKITNRNPFLFKKREVLFVCTQDEYNRKLYAPKDFIFLELFVDSHDLFYYFGNISLILGDLLLAKKYYEMDISLRVDQYKSYYLLQMISKQLNSTEDHDKYYGAYNVRDQFYLHYNLQRQRKISSRNKKTAQLIQKSYQQQLNKLLRRNNLFRYQNGGDVLDYENFFMYPSNIQDNYNKLNKLLGQSANNVDHKRFFDIIVILNNYNFMAWQILAEIYQSEQKYVEALDFYYNSLYYKPKYPHKCFNILKKNMYNSLKISQKTSQQKAITYNMKKSKQQTIKIQLNKENQYYQPLQYKISVSNQEINSMKISKNQDDWTILLNYLLQQNFPKLIPSILVAKILKANPTSTIAFLFKLNYNLISKEQIEDNFAVHPISQYRQKFIYLKYLFSMNIFEQLIKIISPITIFESILQRQRLMNLMVSILYTQNRLLQAHQYLQKHKEFESESYALLFQHGRIYQKQGEFQKAISCYQMALYLNNSDQICIFLIQCLIKDGQYKKAFREVSKLQIQYQIVYLLQIYQQNDILLASKILHRIQIIKEMIINGHYKRKKQLLKLLHFSQIFIRKFSGVKKVCILLSQQLTTKFFQWCAKQIAHLQKNFQIHVLNIMSKNFQLQCLRYYPLNSAADLKFIYRVCYVEFRKSYHLAVQFTIRVAKTKSKVIIQQFNKLFLNGIQLLQNFLCICDIFYNFSCENFEKVIKEQRQLNRYIKIIPKNNLGIFYCMFATSYHRLNSLQAAIIYFQRSIEISRQQKDIFPQLGKIYIKLDKIYNRHQCELISQIIKKGIRKSLKAQQEEKQFALQYMSKCRSHQIQERQKSKLMQNIIQKMEQNIITSFSILLYFKITNNKIEYYKLLEVILDKILEDYVDETLIIRKIQVILQILKSPEKNNMILQFMIFVRIWQESKNRLESKQIFIYKTHIQQIYSIQQYFYLTLLKKNQNVAEILQQQRKLFPQKYYQLFVSEFILAICGVDYDQAENLRAKYLPQNLPLLLKMQNQRQRSFQSNFSIIERLKQQFVRKMVTFEKQYLSQENFFIWIDIIKKDKCLLHSKSIFQQYVSQIVNYYQGNFLKFIKNNSVNPMIEVKSVRQLFICFNRFNFRRVVQQVFNKVLIIQRTCNTIDNQKISLFLKQVYNKCYLHFMRGFYNLQKILQKIPSIYFVCNRLFRLGQLYNFYKDLTSNIDFLIFKSKYEVYFYDSPSQYTQSRIDESSQLAMDEFFQQDSSLNGSSMKQINYYQKECLFEKVKSLCEQQTIKMLIFRNNQAISYFIKDSELLKNSHIIKIQSIIGSSQSKMFTILMQNAHTSFLQSHSPQPLLKCHTVNLGIDMMNLKRNDKRLQQSDLKLLYQLWSLPSIYVVQFLISITKSIIEIQQARIYNADIQLRNFVALQEGSSNVFKIKMIDFDYSFIVQQIENNQKNKNCFQITKCIFNQYLQSLTLLKPRTNIISYLFRDNQIENILREKLIHLPQQQRLAFCMKTLLYHSKRNHTYQLKRIADMILSESYLQLIPKQNKILFGNLRLFCKKSLLSKCKGNGICKQNIVCTQKIRYQQFCLKLQQIKRKLTKHKVSQ